MKTLHKALDVLEMVSVGCGQPVTPSQVAKELNINLSSSTRIMQTLCERGYLMQISRRDGYVVGPNLATYSCRNSLFNTLVNGAREPLKELSHEIHAMINLSVVHRDHRYVIYHYGYTPGISLRAMANCRRIWNYAENATERLLLAAADPTERRRIVDEIGLPAEFESIETFFAELDQLKKAGTVKFYSKRQKVWVGGGLLTAGKFPTATIGFGVATEHEVDRALEATVACCTKIRENLEAYHSFPY